MSDVDAYVRANEERFREALFSLLRIPSISTDPAHAGDVRRAAEWVALRSAAAGLGVSLEESAGHPVVVARHYGPTDAPTLLVYAHYDVQPPEPLEEWRTPPFEPALIDGRVYARGAADDKAQIILQIGAVEAALARGSLPINLILLFEGEEEIGSPSLVPFVRDRADELVADSVRIADSMLFAPGRPSLIAGMRGIAYFEVEVRTAAHDLHSGQYGGAVPNAAHALATIIASLHDGEGRIAIDCFYDDVAAPPAALLEEWRSLGFDDGAFAKTAGGALLDGEAGYATPERLWIRPALDVNGLYSGYTGPGKKTVLPASATAKLSCRLVPDQDPERIAELLEAHVERVAPRGARVHVRRLQGSAAWREDPHSPLFVAAAHALEGVFGVPPVLVLHGGTLPNAPELKAITGAPVAVMGFALPGANMHGPNEWFPADHLEKGMRTMVRLYDELAAAHANARAGG
jgi:acetylornithine deacetylase/succinyl-diaminopimelate desuccinylase-like protein